MQINKIIAEEINRLNESVSDVTYHFTSPTKIISVLKTNKLYLSPVLGQPSDQDINGGKMYALSLTSSRSTDIGYAASLGSNGTVRLTLNGRLLNNNFKSKRVDYWNRSKDPNHPSYDSQRNSKDFKRTISRNDELEDRIMSDHNEISNFNKYIIQIDVLYEEKPNSRNHDDLIELKNLSDGFNIPLYVYNETKYFNANMTSKAIEIDMESQDSEPYNTRFNSSINDGFKILSYILFRNDEVRENILNTIKTKFGDEVLDRLMKGMDEAITNIKYNIAYPDSYRLNEAITSLTYAVSNNRSSTNELIRYIIKLLVGDMRKYKVNTIKEYINHKVWKGKVTQQQFNEVFNKKILDVINTTYKKEIDNLDTLRFNSVEDDYYDGDFTKYVPEVKNLLDQKVKELKKYCSNYILTNNDMYRYSYVLGSSNLKDIVKIDDLVVPDYIDKENSFVDEYCLKQVIQNVMWAIDNLYYSEVKEMQNQYNSQFTN